MHQFHLYRFAAERAETLRQEAARHRQVQDLRVRGGNRTRLFGHPLPTPQVSGGLPSRRAPKPLREAP